MGGQRAAPGFLRGVATVSRKNLLLRRRGWKGMLMEIAMPAVVFAAFIPVWKVVDTENKPDQVFDLRVPTNDFFWGRWEHPAVPEGDSCREFLPPLCAAGDGGRLPAEMARCGAAEVRSDACVGDLCIRLRPDMPRNCTEAVLYPFAYPASAAVVDVPDFDVVALLRRYVAAHIDSAAADIVGDAAKTGDLVAAVAAGPAAGAAAAGLRAHLNATTYTWRHLAMAYEEEGPAVHYAQHAGSQRVWAVVVVHPAAADGGWAYDIRMNDTAVPATKKVNAAFMSKGLDGEYQKYLTSGFLALQRLIDEHILLQTPGWGNQTAGDAAARAAALSPMPVRAYTENGFLATIGDFLPFLMAIVLLYPVSQLVASMVREKEQRIREVMLIMGLSRAAVRCSWFLCAAVQMALTALVGTVVLKASYLGNADFFLLLAIFLVYLVSVAATAILIASFFSKAQLSAVCGPIIFFGTVIVGSMVGDDVSSSVKNLASIFTTYPFTQALKLVSQYESAGLGVQWSQLYDDEYSLATALTWMVFDTLLYVFLAWYLDNVLPQECGTSRRPWFLLQPSYWCPARAENGFERRTKSTRRTTRAENMIEPITDPAVLARERVTLRGMRKVFRKDDGEPLVAVDNLSLTMFEGQIQVLLGHNGAGKTTAISMLTGMLGIDAGDAQVYGHSARDQMDAIRADIGLCPQHNVLWPDLTCAEHLRFYARVKGVPEAEIGAAVDDALRSVELLDKRDVWSDALSGGMKRKLSVGIALVGGSRFVIFDEPTAGMDVEARRAIWDLLKACKQGRTVLLTTHFMDEADLLGDSIAIMHKGRLHCWGSGLFLKSRLGVGYTLKLDFSGKDAAPVTRRVAEIAGAGRERGAAPVELLSSAGSELCYRLPTSATPNFPALFAMLEGDEGRRAGVSDFGVSVTTLEEIFLKIAHDDEAQDGRDDDEEGDDAGGGAALAAKGAGEKTGLLGSGAAAAAAFAVPEGELLTGGALYTSQWGGLMRKRFNFYKRDKKMLCCQALLPVLLITLACSIDQVPTSDPPALRIDGYDDIVSFPVAPPGAPLAGALDVAVFDVTEVEANSSAAMAGWLLDNAYAHHGVDRWQALSLSDAGATAYHNTSEQHASAVAVNALSAARMAAGAPGGPGVIHARNYPLPLSEWTKTKMEGIQTVSKTSLIYAPFTFVPSVFVGFLVMERARKAKLVQMVSGVRLSAYWLSNFVFDMALFMVTVLLGLIVLIGFDRTEYTGSSALPATFLILTSYGVTGIGVSYLASFYFENHTKAQNILLLANFMPALLLLTAVTVLQMIPSTTSVGEALAWVCRVLPAYCLGEGLQNLAMRELYDALGHGSTGPMAVCSGLGCTGLGLQLVILVAQAPAVYAAVLLHERPALARALRGVVRAAARRPAGDAAAPGAGDREEDPDVARERAATEAGAGREGDLVTVQRLRMEYPARGGAPPKVAVRGLSFGVRREEIFGFLGTNGAGKTTTMGVMSGELPPTEGRVAVGGYDVVGEAELARRRLGYCPQFDALLDLLTPEETIDFYCALRGVPHGQRARITDALVSVLGLGRHRAKRCAALSGGNKRKTSIAIALVGGPSVVLLDEPTAGMDPAARRGLWTALQRIGAGRSVVLTTHHLEEVEALAHRVGIMVDGKLQCLGSLNHLKGKFGGGYELEARVCASPAPLREFVAARFPGAELVEQQGQRLTFRLPKRGGAGGLSLARVFGAMEEGRGRLGVSDYSITQTSLEQVFMSICRREAAGADAADAAAPAPGGGAKRIAGAPTQEDSDEVRAAPRRSGTDHDGPRLYPTALPHPKGADIV